MEKIVLDSMGGRQPPLAEQVAERLAQLIQERRLQGGEKIPNEFELMEQLQVGRGTVREAVKILVARNVLEIQRGRGTFVAARPGQVEDPLGFAYSPDKQQLAQDLCEFRLILEPEIAALAAQRATPEEIAEIRRCCDAVEQIIHRGENHAKEDIAFHEAIAKASHNQVIAKFVPIIQEGVMLFIMATRSELTEMTIRTHAQILQAIENHDSHAAYSAMREHLINNKEHISKEQTTA